MITIIQDEWHWLFQSQPGQRFENRFRRLRRAKDHDELAPRVLRLALAILLFCIGVVFIFLPLPETPFFLLSGGLLATESLSLARFFDRNEMRMRRGCREKTKSRLGISPLVSRLIILSFFLSLIVIGGDLCCHIFGRVLPRIGHFS